jgi:hypothetical protein
MAVRSVGSLLRGCGYCWTCLRDTLNRVTTTIDATRQNKDVNAAG